MGRHSVQFCPQGHDTFVVGRHSHGRCKACVREYQAEYTRRHRERTGEYKQQDELDRWRLPKEPFLSFAFANVDRLDEKDRARIYMWARRRDTIRLSDIDRISIQLGSHPAILYPELYFQVGEPA